MTLMSPVTHPAEPGLLTRRLRDETSDLHHAIEAEPAFARLTCPSLSVAAYAGHLEGLFGFYDPCEAALRAHLAEAALNLGARLIKTDLLREDLAALGLSPATVAALPRCAAPDLSRRETAWGYVYVLEGATLGGKMLARGLRERLGLEPGRGLSFHLAYGEEGGRMWRDFKRATDACAPGLDGDAVVAGAQRAFADLAAWMGAARIGRAA